MLLGNFLKTQKKPSNDIIVIAFTELRCLNQIYHWSLENTSEKY